MENNSQNLGLMNNSLPLTLGCSFSEKSPVPTSPQLATLMVRVCRLGDWT